MASKRTVGPSAVREWATEAGVQVGARGRFSAELLDQFHAANPKVKYTVGHVEGQTIKGVRVTASGRTIPVQVKATPAQVREWADAQGLDVGARGRISAEVKAAFAATPR